MKEIRSILYNYFEILEENRSSKYLLCKTVSVDFDKSESTDELWEKHDKINKKVDPENNIPKQSLLDLKIEIASRIFRNCCFCERRCGVNRTIKYGNCGVMQSRVSSEFLHLGEETVLIPSHTIFFSGCTFHCVFCQNWNISRCACGTSIEPDQLINVIEH